MSDNLEPKRGGRLRRALGKIAAILLALAVVVALLFALFPKTFNLDRISRYFSYLGRDKDESFGVISYDADASNDFAAFADGLLVGNNGGLTLLDIYGVSRAVTQGSLPEPVLECCQTLGVCYSPGSSYLAGINSDGKTVFDQNLSGTVIDLDLCGDGWLCCLTSEGGAKSVATVYNPEQEPFFRLSSRSQYLHVCAVSPRGDSIAAVGLGEKDGAFRSLLTILGTDEAVKDLDGKDSSALRIDLGSELIYDAKFLDNGGLCLIGQSRLLFYDTDGRLLSEHSYADGSLQTFAFGSGFVAAAFRENQAGEEYSLLSFDPEGGELGSAAISDRLVSLSAAEGYVAVLTDQGIEIYDRALRLHNRSGTAFAATAALARPDGSALMVGNSKTRLYVP